MRITFAIGSLVAALAFPATAAAQEIVVKRVAGLDRAERIEVREDAGVTLDETLSLPDTERVVAPPGELDEALAALNADPDVVYAEPELQVTLQSNDAQFGGMWGLHNTGQTVWTAGIADADIDAPEAWATSKGAGATVAVVDTGVEVTHPDLAGQLTGNAGERGNGRETNGVDDDQNGKVDDWLGWDYVSGDNAVDTQANFHGTHVSGTVAALMGNSIGVAGVAPEAKVVPIKIFGAPDTSASSSVIALAFDYAGDLGVDVVNASLGGLGSAQIVTDAINAHPDTLYVVSAGNSNDNAALYMPCNSPAPNLVCIGSSDNQDVRSDFSNYSATAVDLFAPGTYIVSAYLNGAYAYANGTSMAAPHVAGAAALLVSARPSATVAQLRSALLGSVDAKAALSAYAVTGGRLNAASALTSIIAGATPTPTPSPTATPTPAPPAPTPTPAPPAPDAGAARDDAGPDPRARDRARAPGLRHGPRVQAGQGHLQREREDAGDDRDPLRRLARVREHRAHAHRAGRRRRHPHVQAHPPPEPPQPARRALHAHGLDDHELPLGRLHGALSHAATLAACRATSSPRRTSPSPRSAPSGAPGERRSRASRTRPASMTASSGSRCCSSARERSRRCCWSGGRSTAGACESPPASSRCSGSRAPDSRSPPATS